jgi:hypothetical protein
VRHHLTDGAPKVCLERHAVHRRQVLVQAEVAQLAIEQREARIRGSIERIQLREMVVSVIARVGRFRRALPAVSLQA